MSKAWKKGGDRPAPVVHDERFSSMHTDATFKKSKKDSKKVKVDDRFKSVLTDDRFRVAPGDVDVYGRKSKKSAKAAAKELSDFYQIDEEERVEDEELPTTTDKKKSDSGKPKKVSKKADAQGEDPESRLDYLNRLARGEISGSSDDSDSSSSDEGEEDSSSDESEVEEQTRAASKKAQKKKKGKKLSSESGSDNENDRAGALVIPGEGEVETGESTYRLALQNCDWGNLKAQDIMVALQSFCPTGRTIRRVTVYPSDFGKESMSHEAIHGPPDIWTKAQRAQRDTEEAEAARARKGKGRGDDDSGDIGDDDSGESGDDDESLDEEEEDDVYDGIVTAAGGGDGDDSDEASEDDEEEEEEEAEDGEEEGNRDGKTAGKKNKVDKKGDFRRRKGAVGVVLQDELVRRGMSRPDDLDNYRRDPTAADGASKKKSMKQIDEDNGFDVVALRAYELSKLRYYFAIAECESVETADALYQQLDGVEFGHSSMVFDLRFVPDDVSFADREVRDSCSEVGIDYKPPDFIVNALQHTNVQCTWDEGEKERDRKLTNINQWRQLNESEFMQYVASSDSEDEDEDGDEEADNNDDKKKRAAKLRKLLLGDVASSDDDDDEAASDDGNDDFFAAADADSEDGSEAEVKNSKKNKKADKKADKKSKNKKNAETEGEEGGDMVFSYVPNADKELLEKKKLAQKLKEETPFEAMQRKQAEKKKARKQAWKQRLADKNGGDGDEDDDGDNDQDLSHYDDYQAADSDDDNSEDGGKNKKGKNKKEKEGKGKSKNKRGAKGVGNHDGNDDVDDENSEAAQKSRAQLELLYAGEDGDDDKEGYDMRAVIKEEKERQKKHKKRKNKGDKKDEKTSDDFSIDLQDSRFSRLLEGDGAFGIDRTANDFKETPAMRTILDEQRKRRLEKEKNGGSKEHAEKVSGAVGDGKKDDGSKDVDVNSLVNKLKRKFAEQPKPAQQKPSKAAKH